MMEMTKTSQTRNNGSFERIVIGMVSQSTKFVVVMNGDLGLGFDWI
jgi:hypothetical protein